MRPSTRWQRPRWLSKDRDATTIRTVRIHRWAIGHELNSPSGQTSALSTPSGLGHDHSLSPVQNIGQAIRKAVPLLTLEKKRSNLQKKWGAGPVSGGIDRRPWITTMPWG